MNDTERETDLASEHLWQAIIDGLLGYDAARELAIRRLYTTVRVDMTSYMRLPAIASRAEDLLQDVVVRVLGNYAEFTGNGLQFRGFVWTIARNVRIDALRAVNAKEIVDDDSVAAFPDPNPSGQPEHHFQNASMLDCVRRGFRTYAQRYPERAQVLTWVAKDGIDLQEVAKRLGRKYGATREYVSQCYKKLQPLLAPCRDYVAV